MAKEKSDLMYGTLDMLILKALQHEPRHGLAVADRIQQISQEVLRVEQGSLYPALYRLEAEGLIKAEWGISDKNRKARFYKLTSAGRKRLTAEKQYWDRITAAVNIPVQAVGGLTIEQIMRLPEMNAPLVVVGAPLAISDRAFEAGGPDEQLEAVLREVVEVVHGGQRTAAE